MKPRIAIALFLFTATLFSQEPSAKKPAFEVASIKPSAPGNTRRFMTSTPGGGFIATNYPLKGLVANAYSARGFEVFGGSGWMETDGWEIDAKAPEDNIPSRTELGDVTHPRKEGLMLLSLLEDRFKLKSHIETRELPVYELVVARGGSKMKLSDDQTPIVPDAGPRPAPGLFLTPDGRFQMARGTLTIGGSPTGSKQFNSLAIPLSNFINIALINELQRPVIDKTGLQGLYDIKISWAPDAPVSPGAEPPKEPYLFTAIQEQLGLRLVSTKGPVDVVVIDSAEKPEPN